MHESNNAARGREAAAARRPGASREVGRRQVSLLWGALRVITPSYTELGAGRSPCCGVPSGSSPHRTQSWVQAGLPAVGCPQGHHPIVQRWGAGRSPCCGVPSGSSPHRTEVGCRQVSLLWGALRVITPSYTELGAGRSPCCGVPSGSSPHRTEVGCRQVSLLWGALRVITPSYRGGVQAGLPAVGCPQGHHPIVQRWGAGRSPCCGVPSGSSPHRTEVGCRQVSLLWGALRVITPSYRGGVQAGLPAVGCPQGHHPIVQRWGAGRSPCCGVPSGSSPHRTQSWVQAGLPAVGCPQGHHPIVHRVGCRQVSLLWGALRVITPSYTELGAGRSPCCGVPSGSSPHRTQSWVQAGLPAVGCPQGHHPIVHRGDFVLPSWESTPAQQ
ncbi:uncharacterized protein [Canis lupus baileyi]|uniref:uncharacterized protein n=1 Tax=Canis lupus baileyi TaxID=143281 RepID=UPI003B97BDE8